MFDAPSSQGLEHQTVESLDYQKLLNFTSWVQRYLLGGGGGEGGWVPQTSSSYSAKVFICFNGNHEPQG